jgi:hypothetical protein
MSEDIDRPDDVPIDSVEPRPRRWPWWVAAASLLVVVVLAGYNATIWIPVSSALDGEHDVSMVAYRRWLVSPGTVVIDIRSIEAGASMADVDRNLFKTAEALKDHEFTNVVLAYEGEAKWLMDAARFRRIGQERAWQNPIFVMRTMQQDIDNLDGSPAFPPLYGGWLGVLGAELDQHREFHERWWLTDALGTHAATLSD